MEKYIKVWKHGYSDVLSNDFV